MNDEFHTYVTKAAEGVSLTPQERDRMHLVLKEYMAMKPIRTPMHSPMPRGLAWFLSARPVAAALVVALFASGAGISYAAENTLPGDALYAVKTQVNEPIEGALAVSASAKAAWASGVANERLKEAAVLAAEGRLSSNTEEDLQANFEAHAQVATANIQEEASSSPQAGSQTAVKFAAQLSAYQQILAQIDGRNDASTTQLRSAIESAQGQVAVVQTYAEKTYRTSATSTESETLAASLARDAARKQLAESLKNAHADSGALATSSAQDVALQLQHASATISTGNGYLGKDAVSQALGAYQIALAATEQVGVFLDASSAIHDRTGLVIGGQASSTSRDSSGGKFAGGDKHSQGSDLSNASSSTSIAAATSVRAAATMRPAVFGSTTASGTASVSSATQATTSSQTGFTTDSEDSTSSSANDGNASPSILPISVPVPSTLP